MQETRRTTSYALVLGLFLVAFVLAKLLNLDDQEPSTRLQYHAMPVAMSVLYFGQPYDYTANFSVAMAFQNSRPLAENVQRVLDPAFSRGTDVYFWNVDDRGSADFVILSTLLFGPTLKGLFNFYFIVFGLIIAVFIAGHRRSPVAVSYLVFALTAFVMCLPLWIMAPFNGGESSVHMSEARLFELLSLFCITHFFFFAMQRGRATSLEIGALLAQLFLFVFLLHARSSIMWQVVALILMLTACVIARYGRGRSLNRRALAVMGGLAAAVWVALPLYKHAAYHPAYFEHAGQRTTWHNFLLGLSFSPEIRLKYDIHSTDQYAIQAAVRFAHKDEPDFPIQDVTQSALNSLGGHNDYDWKSHEANVRKLVMTIFRDDPIAFMKTFVYDKPKAMLALMTCMAAPTSAVLCNVQKPGKIMPSIMPWLLSGILVVLMLAMWRRSPIDVISGDRGVWLYTTGIALFALTPPIIFYPTLVIMAPFLMFSLILFFLLIDRGARIFAERRREVRA